MIMKLLRHREESSGRSILLAALFNFHSLNISDRFDSARSSPSTPINFKDYIVGKFRKVKKENTNIGESHLLSNAVYQCKSNKLKPSDISVYFPKDLAKQCLREIVERKSRISLIPSSATKNFKIAEAIRDGLEKQNYIDTEWTNCSRSLNVAALLVGLKPKLGEDLPCLRYLTLEGINLGVKLLRAISTRLPSTDTAAFLSLAPYYFKAIQDLNLLAISRGIRVDVRKHCDFKGQRQQVEPFIDKYAKIIPGNVDPLTLTEALSTAGLPGCEDDAILRSIISLSKTMPADFYTTMLNGMDYVRPTYALVEAMAAVGIPLNKSIFPDFRVATTVGSEAEVEVSKGRDLLWAIKSKLTGHEADSAAHRSFHKAVENLNLFCIINSLENVEVLDVIFDYKKPEVRSAHFVKKHKFEISNEMLNKKGFVAPFLGTACLPGSDDKEILRAIKMVQEVDSDSSVSSHAIIF